MKARSPLPPETRPGSPQASPGARTEETLEVAGLGTPPHCCVTGFIPVPRSSSINPLQEVGSSNIQQENRCDGECGKAPGRYHCLQA